jgi:ABC-2 type transport system ATP-binding protein
MSCRTPQTSESSASPIPGDPPMLELRDVRKAFGGKPALHGLSLRVARGEIFGLLGHNGAGKSTSLGVLLGQVYPDAGEAFINGASVQSERATALSRTGAIFEAPRFYDYMSGWQNLEIFTSYSAVATRREMEDAIETVGLTARIRDRVQTYSQGMRQRLGLAQALVPAPDLILLDEPTNGLDPEGIHEMRELIKRLNRERGITVLFCSHLLSEVEQLCDRVAILNRGRKIFDGRWSELSVEKRRVRFETDDWPRAAALLGGVPGVQIAGPGDVLLEDGLAVADLVARLVGGGVRLSAVEPVRRNLEQVYLEMSHANSGGDASLIS